MIFNWRQKIRSQLILIVCLFSILAGLIYLQPGHEWGDDFAAYLLQAHAIVNKTVSGFIEDNRRTVEHSEFLLGPITYPWGTPLLFSPMIALFGDQLWPLKVLNLIFYFGFLVFLMVLFRDRWRPKTLLFVIAIFALNPPLLQFCDQLLSDIPFLFFSTLGLFLIQRIFAEDKRIIGNVFDAGLMGLVFAFCYSIRGTGLALLPTLAFAQFLFWKRHPHFSKLTLTIPYLVFALLTVGLNRILPRIESNHMSLVLGHDLFSITQLAKSLYENIGLGAELFEGVVFLNILYWVLLPVALVGLICDLRARRIWSAYFLVNMGILWVWPLHGGQRFIFPLLPALAVFFVSGYDFLKELLRKRNLSPRWISIVPVLFSVVLVNSGMTILRDGVKLARQGRELGGGYSPEAQEFFGFIRANTPDGASVAFFKPRVLRLMTGRQSWAVTGTEHLWELQFLGVIEGWNDYQPSKAQLQKLEAQGALRSVYSKPPFSLYEIVH